MKHYEAAEASCTRPGNAEYWHCETCNLNFADEQGIQELANTEVSALGHKAERVEAKEPSAEEPGNIEYWYCSQCGQYFADEDLTKVILKEDTVLEAERENADSPQTGDSSRPWLWFSLLLLAAGSMTGIAVYARKFS